VDRIAIIGCGGSGKSHLARELGSVLGVTPVHLDGPYYNQDWKPLDRDRFAALQRELVAAPRWVIDGNYASGLPIRLEAADTVIFLDLPARTCLRGIAQRRLRHPGGQHATIGVYDRITWSFVRYIAGYRRHQSSPPLVSAVTRFSARTGLPGPKLQRHSGPSPTRGLAGQDGHRRSGGRSHRHRSRQ